MCIYMCSCVGVYSGAHRCILCSRCAPEHQSPSSGADRRLYPPPLLSTSDISCERPLPAHLASLHPSEFILRPGDTRQVSAVTPSAPHSQDVGAVLVLSGDETLRQELRRRPPGAPPSQHTPANLRTINFQVRDVTPLGEGVTSGGQRQAGRVAERWVVECGDSGYLVSLVACSVVEN